MNLSIFKNSPWIIISKLLLIGCMIYFATILFAYHGKLIVHPYPLEYREGAILSTTQLMVEGKNPFNLQYQPQYTNVYGIFYHILVYPLAKIFGPTFLVHRLLTGLFVLANVAMIIAYLKVKNVNSYLTIFSGLFYYAFLLFPSTTTAYAGPNSLGIFLLLGTIIIPTYFNFSTKSLIVSILCGILGFYTKSYFIIGLVYVGVFLFLFRSKKSGVLFGLFSLGVFAISIFAMTRIFDCYFTNCLFNHVSATGFEVSHMKKQIFYFFDLNREFLIFAIIFLIVSFFKSSIIQSFKRIRINLLSIEKPLFNKELNMFWTAFLFSSVLIIFKLGGHGGSYMAYLFHLMTPFLILAVIISVTNSKNYQWIAVCALVLNSFFLMTSNFNMKSKPNVVGWQQLENLVKTNNNILHSPVITNLILQEGKPLYNNGMSEYFVNGTNRSISFLRQPPNRKVFNHQLNYRNQILEAVKAQEFDLLVVTRNMSKFAPQEIVQYYQYQGSIMVDLPFCDQHWDLTIWKPKKKQVVL